MTIFLTLLTLVCAAARPQPVIYGHLDRLSENMAQVSLSMSWLPRPYWARIYPEIRLSLRARPLVPLTVTPGPALAATTIEETEEGVLIRVTVLRDGYPPPGWLGILCTGPPVPLLTVVPGGATTLTLDDGFVRLSPYHPVNHYSGCYAAPQVFTESGACCDGGTCLKMDDYSCSERPFGQWCGAGTTCEDVECPAPRYGACCDADGSCRDGVAEPECMFTADAAFWPATACGDLSCDPLGSCWFDEQGVLCWSDCLKSVCDTWCAWRGSGEWRPERECPRHDD